MKSNFACWLINMLPLDVLNIISSYSNNKDILAFLSCCKNMWHKRSHIFFYGKYEIRKDHVLFERMVNVVVYSKTIVDLATNKTKSSIPPYAETVEINFNEPIDGYVPKKVVKLTLGVEFNHPIDGAIPNTVETLVLGNNFNHPIDGLPSSITNLSLGKSFTYPLATVPPGVIHLIVLSIYARSQYPVPPTVKSVTFDDPDFRKMVLSHLNF